MERVTEKEIVAEEVAKDVVKSVGKKRLERAPYKRVTRFRLPQGVL